MTEGETGTAGTRFGEWHSWDSPLAQGLFFLLPVASIELVRLAFR
jgi:hypothetical protein